MPLLDRIRWNEETMVMYVPMVRNVVRDVRRSRPDPLELICEDLSFQSRIPMIDPLIPLYPECHGKKYPRSRRDTTPKSAQQKHSFVQPTQQISPPLLVIPLLRSLKPFRNRLYHLPKPIEVQPTQKRRAGQVRQREPRRYGELAGVLHGSPDVLVHAVVLVRAPDQAAAGESGEEGDGVDELQGAAGHAQLVEPPVDVEEGGGELVEDEVDAVVVDERSLKTNISS